MKTGRPKGDAMTGEQVRRIRKRLGLTQVQLAAQLGVTENTLARWERGTVGVSAAVARLIRFVEADKKGR